MSPFETFVALREAAFAPREAVAPARTELSALESLYDTLAPVPPADMIGEWGGGVFDTGHPGERQLVTLGWVGKHFRAPNDVDPIVVRTPEGRRVASPALGSASLRNVEHRGVVTATMVYDKHPIFDHFRRLDERFVLGCMDRKGDAFPLYFWLERLDRVPPIAPIAPVAPVT